MTCRKGSGRDYNEEKMAPRPSGAEDGRRVHIREDNSQATRIVVHEVTPPLEQDFHDLRVSIRNRPRANFFHAYPSEVVDNLTPVDGLLETANHLGNIAFILVPALRIAGYSEGIPNVMENLVHATDEFSLLP